MEKAEKIFKGIEEWVKEGKENLLLSAKNYEFMLIKSQIKDGLITIFKLGDDYADSVMDELSRGHISVLGHYIPKIEKFLGFNLYLPGVLAIDEKPKNNILISEVKEEIAGMFSDIIHSKVKEELDNGNEEFTPPYLEEYKKELANIWVNGFENVLPQEKFPRGYVSLDDVTEYLLHGKDIIEKLFNKTHKDSYAGIGVYKREKNQENLRRFYKEKLKTYTPRETDIAFKEQQKAIQEAFANKRFPKTLRATIKLDWDNLSPRVKETVPKTDKPIYFEITLKTENLSWDFHGLSELAFDITSASEDLDKRNLRKWSPLYSSFVSFSAIEEIRYSKKTIYQK